MPPPACVCLPVNLVKHFRSAACRQTCYRQTPSWLDMYLCTRIFSYLCRAMVACKQNRAYIAYICPIYMQISRKMRSITIRSEPNRSNTMLLFIQNFHNRHYVRERRPCSLEVVYILGI